MASINSIIIIYCDFSGIASTILPPLNEEFFRFLSFVIGGPIIIIFTVFLAFIEFASYVLNYHDQFFGWELYAFILIRIFCVLAHFTLFWIQFQFYKKSVKYNNYGYLISGFMLATSAHIFWNSTLSLYIYNLIR